MKFLNMVLPETPLKKDVMKRRLAMNRRRLE
jgi:hypothetical protein